MEDLVASITAMSTSRMRALHTRCDPQPVLDDPWGDRLVPASLLVAAVTQRVAASQRPPVVASADELERAADQLLRASPAFTNVILRSRYTEDALRAALASGVRQYVLLGAGFDSYALRLPPEAEDVTVIEIDHPATQTLKRQRLAECGLTLPDNVQLIAADFACESLEAALAKSRFRRTEPAFFAWLGVTMYLTREANRAMLKQIAQCSAPGSLLAFSYIDQKLFDAASPSEAARFGELDATVRQFGEPFVSGFHPARLAAELYEAGMELVEDVDEFQMLERYDPQGINGLRPVDRSRVALARVRAGQPASMNACVKTGVAAQEYLFAEGCFITELSNSPDDHDASVARARLETGQSTRWHFLRNTGERYVILQGEGRVEVGDLPAQCVRVGDVVVIPAGIRQRIINTGADDLVFLAICTPRFTPAAYVDIDE